MPSINRINVFLIVAVAGCAPGAASVGEQQPVATSCAAARKNAGSDDHVTYRDALMTLVGCGDVGVHAIVTEWTHPPDDSVMVFTLAGASSRLRDARVYSAVGRSFVDRGNTDAVRLAAVTVLVSYLDSSLVVVFRSLPPTESGAGYVLTGKYDHPISVRVGSSPLPPGVRSELLQLLDDVGHEGNARVAKVAQYLGRWLRAGDM